LQRYAEAECKVSYIPCPYPTYGPKYIVGPESWININNYVKYDISHGIQKLSKDLAAYTIIGVLVEETQNPKVSRNHHVSSMIKARTN
jgi:hypothetical protein